MTGAEVDFDQAGADSQRWLRQALGLSPGETPFPWQRELLGCFVRGGFFERTPVRFLDLPTGLGKTSVMAIWLVARACGASLPRRLVYVVDRRAVVDQATDVALSSRDLVDTDVELRESLGIPDGRSLPISTLRGQYVDNREWLEDPAVPAIVVGTVDMVGSRLLFEGYGVSRKMRPYQAGLLGADALVVLDEAHLVPPFEHLLQAVAADPALRPRDVQYGKHIPPFRVLALSATRRASSDGVFGLTDEDRKHKVVRRRLEAKKTLRVEALSPGKKLEEELATQAWALADGGQSAVRVLVYDDSREVARKAKNAVEMLAKATPGRPAIRIQTELLVGERRVRERDLARKALETLGFLAGSAVEREHPVFLFATSAGEVGVDLDADHLVCDVVAWERMVQRFGRVNRRGDGAANVVVVAHAEAGDDRLEAIKKLPATGDRAYDASPEALRHLSAEAAMDEALRQTLEKATTPEPLRPALTRPLVDAWSMTSLETHTGRPAIEPWLRGWMDDDAPQTAVVWRRHLPVRPEGPPVSSKEIEAFFEAAPSHTSEMLETETFRVVKWLGACAKRIRKTMAEQESAGTGSGLRDAVVAFVLDHAGRLRSALTLTEIAEPKDKKELHGRLAGATLVLDTRLAGLREGLLDDTEAESPPTADDGGEWLGEDSVGFRIRPWDTGTELPKEPNWRERLRFASALTDEGDVSRWLIVEKWRDDTATEDDLSLTSPQRLEEHQSQTESYARQLAIALKLDTPLREALRLAASIHDEGKRASRWQRAFHAPGDGVYAKTEGPIDHRLLDGYRHELGSFLHAEADARVQRLSEEDRDLVLHLVAAHHGFARPLIPTSGCEDRPPSALEVKAAEIALRFARLQARWGPWGLAWLEALLRAADHQASRANAQPGR